jgi:hypothetical protein
MNPETLPPAPPIVPAILVASVLFLAGVAAGYLLHP